MQFVMTMSVKLALSAAAVIAVLTVQAQAGQIATLVESVEAYAAAQATLSRTDPQAPKAREHIALLIDDQSLTFGA